MPSWLRFGLGGATIRYTTGGLRHGQAFGERVRGDDAGMNPREPGGIMTTSLRTCPCSMDTSQDTLRMHVGTLSSMSGRETAATDAALRALHSMIHDGTVSKQRKNQRHVARKDSSLSLSAGHEDRCVIAPMRSAKNKWKFPIQPETKRKQKAPRCRVGADRRTGGRE